MVKITNVLEELGSCFFSGNCENGSKASFHSEHDCTVNMNCYESLRSHTVGCSVHTGMNQAKKSVSEMM
jgi:hypothetical protein